MKKEIIDAADLVLISRTSDNSIASADNTPYRRHARLLLAAVVLVVMIAVGRLTAGLVVIGLKEEESRPVAESNIPPPPTISFPSGSGFTQNENKKKKNNQLQLRPSRTSRAPNDAYYFVDYTCTFDSDCAPKDVGNCCGSHIKCVNSAFNPDFSKRCQHTGASMCGWTEIDRCICEGGQCHGYQEPLRIPP